MKRLMVLALLFVALAGGNAAAQKARKLPAGSYISTAKIEILSADSTRYAYALSMLDSLFMYYGPHCEGIFWAGQIYVDYYVKAPTSDGRKHWAQKMVAYRDTLRSCCASDSIDKKFKKDCAANSDKSDSTLIGFWQERYNEGVEQLNQLIDIDSILKVETDSFVINDQKKLQVLLRDSLKWSMELALILDPSDGRPWMGLANGAELQGDFVASNTFLEKAVAVAKPADKPALLLRIGYNYASDNKFCEAIPFFRDYMKSNASDTSTAENLAICFNNCQMIDSGAVVYRQILSLSPNSVVANRGLARYYQDLGRMLTDSVNKAEEAKQEAIAKQFISKRYAMFDSARIHSKVVFEQLPTDLNAAESYALYSYLVDKNDEALLGYERASTLNPSRVDNWNAMGDLYFSKKEFAKAAASYEKALELEPKNKATMERLAFLYGELRQPEKQQALNKKLANP